MWACANGHRDVVALLAQWDSSTMNITDRNGKCVAEIAVQRGHTALAEELKSGRILSARGRSTGETLACPSVLQGNAEANTHSRQMLMAKRSSVDNVSNQHSGGNHDCSGWRKPAQIKSHRLSRFLSSLILPRLSLC